METPEFAAVVAADLNGPVFCENPDYVTGEQLAECKELMGLIAEPAVGALGSLLKVSASRICTENGCTR